MSGKDNLIPMDRRSKDEVRNIAAKGGVNSGKSRRKKRDMKNCMEMLLALPLSQQEDYDMLYELGVNFEELSHDDITNMLAVNAA